jgi:hypothetical protein
LVGLLSHQAPSGISRNYVISVDGDTGIVFLPAWTNTDPDISNGIASGITFTVGSNAIQVLEQLIYPYQPVSFTAFSIGLGSSPFDLGRTFGAGTYTSTWSTSGPAANWTAGSLVIRNTTNSTLIISGLNYNSSPQGISLGLCGYANSKSTCIWNYRSTTIRKRCF